MRTMSTSSGAEAGAFEVGGEAARAIVHAEVAAVPAGEFVALAGVDEDEAGAGLDQERAHLHGYAVFVVGADDPFPEDAGHETEEAAAVDQLASVAHDMTGDRTDLEGVGHGFCSCCRRA